MNWYTIYIIVTNAVGAGVFAWDKHLARQGRERIPERTLHLLEASGGCFATLLLMYLIRHKNRKPAYYLWTWGFVAVWTAMIVNKLTS